MSKYSKEELFTRVWRAEVAFSNYMTQPNFTPCPNRKQDLGDEITYWERQYDSAVEQEKQGKNK